MHKVRWKGLLIICAALCISGVTAGVFFCMRQSVVTMETTAGKDTEKNILFFYPGEFEEGFSPLSQINNQGEENILSLCFSRILERDENGGRSNLSVISPWKEGETALAHISGSYQPDSDTTTITIMVNPEARTASGSAITADDIIFNYYLRCDASNSWGSPFGENRIVGQQEYLYGSEELDKRKKEVANLLKKPPKELKEQLIEEIVRPGLEQEFLWVKSLYENKNYAFVTEKYKEAKDLFAYYYAYQTQYQSKNKTEQKVFEDIVQQYGWHYERLSAVTNEKYDSRAVRMALCYLLKKKGKDQVKSISGIRRQDERTVEIQIFGDSSYIDRLCDIWILPLSQYGSRSLYDGEENFGFVKGQTQQIVEKSTRYYSGTGNYYTEEIQEEQILLFASSYGAGAGADVRTIEATKEFQEPEAIVQALLERKLDLAWIENSEKLEKLLTDKNTGASHSIGAVPVEDSEQDYCVLFQTYTVNATTLPEKLTKYHTIFEELAGVRLNSVKE